MKKSQLAACAALVLWALGARAAVEPVEPVSIVPNGDFSLFTAGKPDRWETSGNPKDVDMILRPAKDDRAIPAWCSPARAARRSAPGPTRCSARSAGPRS